MQTGRLLILVLCAGVMGSACFGEGNAKAEKDAVDAAQKWLALIDAGKYDQSWKESSAFLRNAVTQEQWRTSMQAFRVPLGKKLSRTVKSSTYSTTLPGAPDGKYVVIQFSSSFENKKTAVETVTPMLDTDGKWRVSGYYIN